MGGEWESDSQECMCLKTGVDGLDRLINFPYILERSIIKSPRFLSRPEICFSGLLERQQDACSSKADNIEFLFFFFFCIQGNWVLLNMDGAV